MEWIASAAFGLEGMTGRDLKHMGMKGVRVMDVGGATFEGGFEDAFRANLWLRTCDRIMLVMARFEARSYEELFQGVRAVAWETLLPEDWEKMELFDRRNYLRNAEKKSGTLRRETVSNIEIWAECFGNDPADMSGKDTLGITAIMVRIGGWSKSEKRIRTRLYGQQRVFVREV